MSEQSSKEKAIEQKRIRDFLEDLKDLKPADAYKILLVIVSYTGFIFFLGYKYYCIDNSCSPNEPSAVANLAKEQTFFDKYHGYWTMGFYDEHLDRKHYGYLRFHVVEGSSTLFGKVWIDGEKPEEAWLSELSCGCNSIKRVENQIWIKVDVRSKRDYLTGTNNSELESAGTIRLSEIDENTLEGTVEIAAFNNKIKGDIIISRSVNNDVAKVVEEASRIY